MDVHPTQNDIFIGMDPYPYFLHIFLVSLSQVPLFIFDKYFASRAPELLKDYEVPKIFHGRGLATHDWGWEKIVLRCIIHSIINYRWTDSTYIILYVKYTVYIYRLDRFYMYNII